jgi:uncharacterized protein YacL
MNRRAMLYLATGEAGMAIGLVASYLHSFPILLLSYVGGMTSIFVNFIMVIRARV